MYPIFISPHCHYHHHSIPLCVLQEFATSGSNNTDTGKSGGHLETKYKVQDLGLSFNQKWNTDNTLTTEVTMEDQVGANTPNI